MLTRGNRELLGGTKGSTGQEPPWVLASTELTPCNPRNSLLGVSTAWREYGNDLRPLSSPVSDAYWTVDGSDLTPPSS
jgi:hypothetical protein